MKMRVRFRAFQEDGFFVVLPEDPASFRRRPQGHLPGRPSSERLFFQRPSRPAKPQNPVGQGYVFQGLPFLTSSFVLPVPAIPVAPITPLTRNFDLEISDYVSRLEDSIGSEDSSVLLASVGQKRTSLILKPVAKAVAGPKGIAVASPVAKAIVRKGEEVDIEFDPDAVAIAGPGGEARVQPKLVISYIDESDEKPESNQPVKEEKKTSSEKKTSTEKAS